MQGVEGREDWCGGGTRRGGRVRTGAVREAHRQQRTWFRVPRPKSPLRSTSPMVVSPVRSPSTNPMICMAERCRTHGWRVAGWRLHAETQCWRPLDRMIAHWRRQGDGAALFPSKAEAGAVGETRQGPPELCHYDFLQGVTLCPCQISKAACQVWRQRDGHGLLRHVGSCCSAKRSAGRTVGPKVRGIQWSSPRPLRLSTLARAPALFRRLRTSGHTTSTSVSRRQQLYALVTVRSDSGSHKGRQAAYKRRNARKKGLEFVGKVKNEGLGMKGAQVVVHKQRTGWDERMQRRISAVCGAGYAQKKKRSRPSAFMFCTMEAAGRAALSTCPRRPVRAGPAAPFPFLPPGKPPHSPRRFGAPGPGSPPTPGRW